MNEKKIEVLKKDGFCTQWKWIPNFKIEFRIAADVFCSQIPFSIDMSIKLIFFISGIMMEINSCSFTEKEKREREKETKFNKIDTIMTLIEWADRARKATTTAQISIISIFTRQIFACVLLLYIGHSHCVRFLAFPSTTIATRLLLYKCGYTRKKKCRTYISTAASSLCECCESMQEKRVRAYNSTNVYFVCCYDMAK